MSEYIDLIQSHSYVIDTYELVKEWDVWVQHKHIGIKKITIKVHLNKDGQYHFQTSHIYQGSEQAGPYLSSDSSAPTIEGALEKAMRQLFSFFNNDDVEARWIEA